MFQVLDVNVDASNLPRRYTRVVYDQCFAFPRILVFFLLGSFQVGCVGHTLGLDHVFATALHIRYVKCTQTHTRF